VRDLKKSVESLRGKILIGGLCFILFLGLIFIGKLVENVKADQIIINQVPITGTLDYWTTPGWKFQKFGETTVYDKAFQIWYSSKENMGDKHDESIKIVFNDAGIGQISGSARVVLPKSDKYLRMIHTEFGSMDNLVAELIMPTIYKVIFSSGPLMSSFESYAAKKNDLIRFIEDQLQFGIYKTTSKEVQKIDEFTGKSKVVTVAEPIEDKEASGGFKRQEVAPFSKYGIQIRAISVEDIVYERKIMDQIDSQQKAFMDVQTAIAEAKKAKQDAIKAEEEGKAKYQEAKWEQEKVNAKEIAEAEKEKTVAKLTMEKAAFQKKADILSGEGVAAKKRLIMQADGALKQKLDAYVEVNKLYADAIARYNGNWVPSTVLGGNGKSVNGAQQLINMLMVKTAKDLHLEANPTK
jgi:regulator of protease activity HflC (stomatin/prohibitin superfamily)